MHHEMQSIVHKFEKQTSGLQPLRYLLQLHRNLQPKRTKICSGWPKKTKSCRTIDCLQLSKGNQTVDDSKRRFLSATLITGIAAGKLLAQESAGKLLPKKTSNERHPLHLREH